jgi:hypothetical protein
MILSLGRFQFGITIPRPPAKWGIVPVRMWSQRGVVFFSPLLMLSFDFFRK